MRMHRNMRQAGWSRRRGFTLIELMVAIALLSVLGLMMITSLRQTSELVATSQSRGEAYARAQGVIARVESDLAQTFTGPGGRMISGYDPLGRQFLAFVRTLPEETSFPGGYFSGSVRESSQRDPNSRDGILRLAKDYWSNWRGANSQGHYRALGGLAEVAYVMDPRGQGDGPQAYRAIMAPIEYPDVSEQLDSVLAAKRWRSDTRFSRASGKPTQPHDIGPLSDMMVWYQSGQSSNAATGGSGSAGTNFFQPDKTWMLVSDDLLHMGFEFWHRDATNWDSGKADGALPFWESAAVADMSPLLGADRAWPPRNYERFKAEPGAPKARVAGREPIAWRDMGFPSAVRVTVTIAARPPFAMSTRVAAQVSESATSVYVLDATGFPSAGSDQSFLRVGSEWMKITGVNGNTFSVERGVRGTKPKSHEPGAPVRAGFTLSQIVNLPAGGDQQ